MGNQDDIHQMHCSQWQCANHCPQVIDKHGLYVEEEYHKHHKKSEIAYI